jgi:hypothetical protein
VLLLLLLLFSLAPRLQSVDHLMIGKRFETEIEIKDSQLYASRYNDD